MDYVTHIEMKKLEANYISKLKVIIFTAILSITFQFGMHRLIIGIENITKMFMTALFHIAPNIRIHFSIRIHSSLKVQFVKK
jgi:hypothetical protein